MQILGSPAVQSASELPSGPTADARFAESHTATPPIGVATGQEGKDHTPDFPTTNSIPGRNRTPVPGNPESAHSEFGPEAPSSPPTTYRLDAMPRPACASSREAGSR